MSALGPRAGGLRLIRLVLILVAVGVVVNTAGNVTLFILNSDRVQQINEERARNTLRLCEETNARHDGTLAELDRLVDALPPGPRKERARAGRDSTVALIEALVPKRRCDLLVERTVKTG